MESSNYANLPHDSRAPLVMGLTISMLVLSVLAVMVRFWARYITLGRAGWWWDDWLCLVTMPFIVAFSGMIFAWLRHGLGRHAYDLDDPSDMRFGLKILWTGFLMANLGCTFPKLSALAFYERVFDLQNKPQWKRANWVLMAITLLWWLGLVLHSVLYCRPFSLYWHPSEYAQRCSHDWSTWLASSIFCVAIDVIILLFPIPHLLPLQLSRQRKLGLLVLFVFGYLVLITTVGRVVATVRASGALNEDLTYQIIPNLCWLISETPVSVISITLPAYFSLLKRASRYGVSSLFSTRTNADLAQESSQAWSGSSKTDTKMSGNDMRLPMHDPPDSLRKASSEDLNLDPRESLQEGPQNSSRVMTNNSERLERAPTGRIKVDKEFNVTRGPEP